MAKFTLLAFVLFLLNPISTFAQTACSLPCQHDTAHWSIQVKEIQPKSSESSSLWFKIKSKDLSKTNVTIDALAESPILHLKIPIFNSVILDSFPQNKEFIFQQWYEKTNTKELELVLTWQEREHVLLENFIINLN